MTLTCLKSPFRSWEEGTLKSPKSCWWQMSTAFPDGREQKWDVKEKTYTQWNPLSFSSFGAKCWAIWFLYPYPLSPFPSQTMVCSPQISPFWSQTRWNYRKQTVSFRAHNFLTAWKGVSDRTWITLSSPATSTFFSKANSLKKYRESITQPSFGNGWAWLSFKIIMTPNFIEKGNRSLCSKNPTM